MEMVDEWSTTWAHESFMSIVKNGAERAALPRVLLDSSASPYLVFDNDDDDDDDDDDAVDALVQVRCGCTATHMLPRGAHVLHKCSLMHLSLYWHCPNALSLYKLQRSFA